MTKLKLLVVAALLLISHIASAGPFAVQAMKRFAPMAQTSIQRNIGATALSDASGATHSQTSALAERLSSTTDQSPVHTWSRTDLSRLQPGQEHAVALIQRGPTGVQAQVAHHSWSVGSRHVFAPRNIVGSSPTLSYGINLLASVESASDGRSRPAGYDAAHLALMRTRAPVIGSIEVTGPRLTLFASPNAQVELTVPQGMNLQLQYGQSVIAVEVLQDAHVNGFTWKLVRFHGIPKGHLPFVGWIRGGYSDSARNDTSAPVVACLP
jgi:hypothetical protein